MKDIINFDPTQIKQSLQKHLSSVEALKDFSYEGSAISGIVDLLVRNTHYIAYLAHMQTNESFLDTAELRPNIVSQARKLGYVPRSNTASKAIIDLVVTPDSIINLPATILMKAGTVFITRYGNSTYTFVNKDDYVLYRNSDNKFIGKKIEIFQGSLITNTFRYDASKQEPTFEIPNANIDTSTLSVLVKSSEEANNNQQYIKAKDLTIDEINADTQLYYIRENANGLYEIEFGDNVLGKQIKNGNVITCTYVNTNDEYANNVESFVSGSSINGYSNISISLNTKSFGGVEKESTQSIKRLAPSTFTSQERAVTAKDYETLLQNKYQFIKSAKAWGGEDNIPPRFGSVFIAINPQEGFILSQNIKNDIINQTLKKYNVGTITPIIIDPIYMNIDLNIGFEYDKLKSTKSSKQIETLIIEKCQEYSQNVLEQFSSKFNNSQLTKSLLEIDSGIESLTLKPLIKQTLPTTKNQENKYEFLFKNSVSQVLIKQNGHSIKDDNGLLNVYDNFNNVIQANVGTVDYDTGYVAITIVAMDDNITCQVTPSLNNINSSQKYILQIDNISIDTSKEVIVNE